MIPCNAATRKLRCLTSRTSESLVLRYLAFSLLQLGLALWVNSLGLLVTLIPAVALMSWVVIPREERYLEARFPSEYVPYKASVRRWL